MKDHAKFVTVGIVADARTPIDHSLIDRTLFLGNCFLMEHLRIVTLMAPGTKKDKSLGHLWHDLPSKDGSYTFEIGTELPFFLPNLAGRPEYLVEVADKTLFVCNRMVRAFVGEGYPTNAGLTYFLAHLSSLQALSEDDRCSAGIHPMPLRSFVSYQFKTKADSAEQAVESDFLSWRDKLVASVASLTSAVREASPKKASHLLPHSSFAGFPLIWLAVAGVDGRKACEQFSGHITMFIPKATENLSRDEASNLKHLLAQPEGSRSYRHSLGLAHTFEFYGYHDLALVQLCIACETALALRLHKYLKQRGVSNRVLKDQFSDITFSQLLNIHLPCIREIASVVNYSNVIGKINWARKMRNNIVHTGCSHEKLETTAVVEAISAVEVLVAFLESTDEI